MLRLNLIFTPHYVASLYERLKHNKDTDFKDSQISASMSIQNFKKSASVCANALKVTFPNKDFALYKF